MHYLLEEQIKTGLPAFEGLDISGTIPLRESLINELLRGKIRLTISSGGRIVAEGLPVTIPLQIEAPGIATPENGLRLTLKVTGFVGFFTSVFSPIINAVAGGKVPVGVQIHGATAVIDLKAILRDRNLSYLIPLIRRVGLVTQNGVLYLNFHIHAGDGV